MHLTALFGKLVLLKLVGRLSARKTGIIFGNFCQRMGVLWIKVAQLMSLRADLFHPELCAELARLQDRAKGFSPNKAKQLLEWALGRSLDDVFDRFEALPCAAASIAQVHKARLKKNGVWVAVKIRRPEIETVFEKDMAVIRFLIGILSRLSIMTFMRWKDMLWEIEKVFVEELDYRYEVSHQSRMRKTLARHQITVPKVFKQFCTREIMVMEFIEGVSMASFIALAQSHPERVNSWLAENQIDRTVLGRRLLHSYLRQVLEDNLFHADLHPGNLILLKNNRLALLDFGSVGSNEGDLLRKYAAYLEALSSGQYAKAIDVFLLISPNPSTSALVQVKEELLRRLQAWGSRCSVAELPYSEKSASAVGDEMVRVMAKHGVHLYWAFFKVMRGWITMDTSLRELIPKSDLPALMKAYQKDRHKRHMVTLAKEIPADLMKLQNLLDWPTESSERAIYRGAMVRRLAQVFEGATTRVSRLASLGFGLAAMVVFLVTVAMGGIFLFQSGTRFGLPANHLLLEQAARFPHLDGQVWVLAFLGLVYIWWSLMSLAGKIRDTL